MRCKMISTTALKEKKFLFQQGKQCMETKTEPREETISLPIHRQKKEENNEQIITRNT